MSPRVRAVAGFKKFTDPQLITTGRGVVNEMKDNPNFPESTGGIEDGIWFGFPETVSPKITFPRTSWICWISLERLNSRRPRLKRVRFLEEVRMQERISVWEDEGGSPSEKGIGSNLATCGGMVP